MIKLLLASALLLFMACVRHEKKQEPIVPEWMSYEKENKWKMDSIQIMNKTIDLFPEELRSHPFIQNFYLQNLLNYRKENNKMMRLLHQHPPSPNPIPDTTIKPKYQYIIKMYISPNEYLYINKIKDSIINAYRSEMGDKTLRLYYEHEEYLRSRAVLDSVIVNEGR